MAGCFNWTNKPTEVLRIHSTSIPLTCLFFLVAPAVSVGACSSTNAQAQQQHQAESKSVFRVRSGPGLNRSGLQWL
jgi:hypothetical protein